MRKLISIVLCVAIIAVLGMTAMPVIAENTAPQTVTYAFSSSDDLANFFAAGPDNGAWGNWSVADGKLQVVGNSGAAWWGTNFMTKNKYTDFTMEFDADVSAGYGIILRAGDDAQIPGSGLNTWFGGNAYCIMHWAPVEQDASVAIYNYNGGDNMLVGCGMIAPMARAHWSISANGNVISFTVTDLDNADNKMSYTYTDSDSLYTAGHIGFYNLTADGVTSFKADNLVITGDPVSAPLPPRVTAYDFSDTAQLDNFFAAGPDNGDWGIWDAADGKLQVTGNEGAQWWGTNFMTKDTYGDFTMEFDADVSAGYGIILRAGDDAQIPGSGLNTWFGGNAYCIMHWAPVEQDASVAIYNYNGGDNMLVGCGMIAPMTRAHWSISANGNVISFTVTDLDNADNKMSYTYTDSKSLYTAGHIGFYNLTADGVTSFKADNLVITGNPVTEATEDLVWYDNFSGATGEDYSVYGYWWNNFTSLATATNYTGRLGNEGVEFPGWCYYYLNGKELADCSVEFDVCETKNQFGIMLRAANPAGTDDGENGYVVMYDHDGVFASREDGSFNFLDGAVNGAPYWQHARTIKHIKVEIKGNVISVYLNRTNKKAISITDDVFKAGVIGIRSLTDAATPSNLVIDNLKVCGTLCGDVNNDKVIDVRDIVRMKKYLADNTTKVAPSALEITGDSLVNADDILRLKKYLLGVCSTVYQHN